MSERASEREKGRKKKGERKKGGEGAIGYVRLPVQAYVHVTRTLLAVPCIFHHEMKAVRDSFLTACKHSHTHTHTHTHDSHTYTHTHTHTTLSYLQRAITELNDSSLMGRLMFVREDREMNAGGRGGGGGGVALGAMGAMGKP